MHKPSIRILPLILLAILLIATVALSQTTTPTSGDDSAPRSQAIPVAGDCVQALDKTLDALEKTRAALGAVTAERDTKTELLAKESAYNGELLKAVALLTSSEKRNKTFFRKLLDQLGAALKAATKPENLAAIAGLIVIVRNLK